MTPNSFLNIPELHQSSETVTIAVKKSVQFFSPLNKTEEPVPPPIVQMLTDFRILFI